jgi:P27 family predicted phage terminase small subunit
MPNRIVPLEIRKLRGNPSRRPIPNTPQAARLAQPPEPPAWLGPQARQEWIRLSPELHRLGLLTALDLSAFALVCTTMGHWLECEAELGGMRNDPAYPELLNGPMGRMARAYARDAIRYMAEFGLSPCARMKLRAEPPEDLGKFKGLLAGFDDNSA